MKPARAASFVSAGIASSRLPSTTSTCRQLGTLARTFSMWGGTKWIIRSSRTGKSRSGGRRAGGEGLEEAARQASSCLQILASNSRACWERVGGKTRQSVLPTQEGIEPRSQGLYREVTVARARKTLWLGCAASPGCPEPWSLRCPTSSGSFNLARAVFGLIGPRLPLRQVRASGRKSGSSWMQFFLIYVSLPCLFYRLIADKPLDQLANWRFVGRHDPLHLLRLRALLLRPAGRDTRTCRNR